MTEHRMQQLIDELNLLPHSEGGYYKEIYRSADDMVVPERFGGINQLRPSSTMIYYLLNQDNFSAFHRIKSDEIWLFLEGAPLLVHTLDKNTKAHSINKIGSTLSGLSPTYVVNKENWFAAEVEDKESYSLVSCIVSPGFDFKDFELAKRKTLLDEYSKHQDIIKKFTRD